MRFECCLTLLMTLAVVSPVGALRGTPSDADVRAQFHHAEQLQKDGNYAEAYADFEKLVLSQDTPAPYLAQGLGRASDCLRRLNRGSATDTLRDRATTAHADDWRLLLAAARDIMGDQHHGFKIAGAFKRGHHRGGGDYMACFERDRVQALQWLQQAMPLIEQDTTRAASDASTFYLFLAETLMARRSGNMAWRLQTRTDIETLPPRESGHWARRRPTQGAPVDHDGTVVLYKIPTSFTAAINDGERWRWALQRAAGLNPTVKPNTQYLYANFLYEQFGVQTMAQFARYLYRPVNDANDNRQNRLALATLGDDETLARLANGIQRFHLPPQHNFIANLQTLADGDYGTISDQAMNQLAQVYENRRQYSRAADTWRRSMARFGANSNNWQRKRLDQIEGNWGQFEPDRMQPNGIDPVLEYRFRNGTDLSLTARRIDIDTLLRDVQDYIKSNPSQPDWYKMRIDNIGYRLVVENEDQYVGPVAAKWHEHLEPATGHYDRRVRFTAPIIKPGAYLVTAELDGGNTSRIVLWIGNTVLVKKAMERQTLLFAADARSGRPIPELNVECFGYRRNYRRNRSGRARAETEIAHFAAFSNRDGMVVTDRNELSDAYQWMIIARTPPTDTAPKVERFACLGFTRVWYPGPHQRNYNRTKAFIMTDRPVYRPGQPIHLKTWLQHVSYAPGHESAFAQRDISLVIQDPQGTKLYEAQHQTDAYGGVALDWTPPADARLGVYRVQVPRYGSGTFRIEEYKKPEFEVDVTSPSTPVLLGETITFSIAGRYYFGAPVTRGTVRYKITRRVYDDVWYPAGPWDWLYGNGYAWLSEDWSWYPGWARWGYPRPRPLWLPRPQPPPELVAEGEAPLDRDGTLTVSIDTGADAELYGDVDQRYELTAEITDASRRTIVGTGRATAARKPFRVCLWADRGFYRVGDTIRLQGTARTLDASPVPGRASIRLLRVRYNDDAPTPAESVVQNWTVTVDDSGRFELPMQADRPGHYRVSCMLTDRQGNTVEGAQLLTVRGDMGTGDFRFDTLQLMTEQTTYAPGDRAKLLIGTAADAQTVLLFQRPVNGAYGMPRRLRTTAHSAVRDVHIRATDRPNIFVEALTVRNGRVHTVVRELRVPPDQRILDVTAKPSAPTYDPGAPARVTLTVRDQAARPVVGACVVSVYDKALDYIAGRESIPDIRRFFWKWRRHHSVRHDTNLDRHFRNLVPRRTPTMQPIGIFGDTIDDDADAWCDGAIGRSMTQRTKGTSPEALAMSSTAAHSVTEIKAGTAPEAPPDRDAPPPTVRKAFADTAYWNGMIVTDSNGMAEIDFAMPENLTAWRIRTWALGAGARVGEASTEVTTSKDLLLRLQAPRFFVERDEVVLSANIHNYLPLAQRVRAELELDGPSLRLLPGEAAQQWIDIAPDDEARINWRVTAVREGEAVVRMLAAGGDESDAMEMRFPVYVHGMLKTDAFSRVIRPAEKSARIDFSVPAARRPAATRLDIRTSPSLAAALVDALPYLAHYPHGCTEQTLNRFLPALMVRQTLRDLGLDLETIARRRARNRDRGAAPQPGVDNPVFDTVEVERMVRDGIKRLVAMQLSDGGWGWFSGWGERATPHTTAIVVQGLHKANRHGAAVPAGVLTRGTDWLVRHQNAQRRRLDNAVEQTTPWKRHADNMDALVFAVLSATGRDNAAMRAYLYRDRNHLSVYSQALLGLAMHRLGQTEARDMLLRNIEQYRVDDAENQTSYLELGNGGYWWHWYGHDAEAHAAYLRLLNAVAPQAERTAGLAKYLLNNRRHGTYWDSTRDTAYCIEALAEYLPASGEHAPHMTVTLALDGEPLQRETITPDDLFSRNDAFVLRGEAVTTGAHRLDVAREGDGPLYVNAALTLFSLEDMIHAAGLELKIDRRLYRLHRQPIHDHSPGANGQPVDRERERFFREAITHATTLRSGDLVEIELTVTSKNDYEYIVVADRKAAGMEPVAVRSGYTRHGLRAYTEYRDERVVFFVPSLARGQHTLSYRVRAEIPGVYSALPARAFGMYVPDLTANSNEVKIRIKD